MHPHLLFLLSFLIFTFLVPCLLCNFLILGCCLRGEYTSMHSCISLFTDLVLLTFPIFSSWHPLLGPGWCHTAQHRVVPHSTGWCHTAQHRVAPHSTAQSGATQHSTAQGGATHHELGTGWWHTAQHRVVPHSTAQGGATQHELPSGFRLEHSAPPPMRSHERPKHP